MTTVVRFENNVTWPIVTRGQHSSTVTTLQFLLRAQGHPIDVTGLFDQPTHAVVRAFQNAKGLAVDGIVGPKTWRAATITVRHGSEGDAVRAVQHELVNRDGGHDLVIDGFFGHDMDQRVRTYQQALRHAFPHDDIAVDGIVGQVTWRALVGGFS
jgi:peptidoglycan hydrolase-like protein with peptidoglycan-binding domain